MQFKYLPLEFIPLIVQHLVWPHHLAQTCLVNKDFYCNVIPLLYEHTAIFAWHKEAKTRATQLFWTLANCPDLAKYVRRLEIRDFPKAIARDRALALTETCVQALRNCVNLVSCTWTRDGSLKDDILDTLTHCPRLQSLEFNGRHTRNYDPCLLSEFKGLNKLSVMMPTPEVAQQLPIVTQQNGQTLQSLSLICKFTSVVNDLLLREMAPSLGFLKHIHLGGCPKVTQNGIIDLLSENSVGIEEMALEGVSPTFMKELSSFCMRMQALRLLQSITLAFPVSSLEDSWLADVESLLFDSPLRRFHLYGSGDRRRAPTSLSATFVHGFVSRHANHLKRFAVLRLPISPQSLKYVVGTARGLEQLFISMWRCDLSALGPIVAQARSLRALHVTYAYDILADAPRNVEISPDDDQGDDDVSDDLEGLGSLFGNNALIEAETERGALAVFDARRPLPSMEELEVLAAHFPESVKQFGVQSRVWQVERIVSPNPDGSLSTKTRLGPYESPEVPDVFLVVRS